MFAALVYIHVYIVFKIVVESQLETVPHNNPGTHMSVSFLQCTSIISSTTNARAHVCVSWDVMRKRLWYEPGLCVCVCVCVGWEGGRGVR